MMERADLQRLGRAMHDLVVELLPVPRSITGDGLRTTLGRLRELLSSLEIHEVPSGTPVLDWTVPDEWNVRDAYVADASGRRVIDWQEHRLHLLQYSEPTRARMPWSELRAHLHTLPEHPEWIPYRTSYYARTWGFCLSHRQWLALAAAGDDAQYDVVIDADLRSGALSYGELLIPGETSDEVLISAHTCHPQLANDNLSAVVVAAFLARELVNRAAPPRLSYRFLFASGTIGAITWLARNADHLDHVRHGLVLATVGDEGPFVYKRSRRGTLSGDLAVDRAVAHVLEHGVEDYEVRDFEPFGYDERQFGSPGFDLPVGRLTRTPHGEYPEYHTSADDARLVTPAALGESLAVLRDLVDVLDRDGIYRNTRPAGEPQLGRRGLYAALGGLADAPLRQRALLWVLNLSDGDRSLLEIADRAQLPFALVRESADQLLASDLLADAA